MNTSTIVIIVIVKKFPRNIVKNIPRNVSNSNHKPMNFLC